MLVVIRNNCVMPLCKVMKYLEIHYHMYNSRDMTSVFFNDLTMCPYDFCFSLFWLLFVGVKSLNHCICTLLLHSHKEHSLFSSF